MPDAPRAYLDHAASTTLRAAAAAAMAEATALGAGNPTGMHAAARAGKVRLEEDRERIAAVLGAAPDEVVLTGGGTEADNLAVKGGARGARAAHGVDGVVVAAFEHKAVLAPAARLGREGFRTSLAPADGGGVVDVDALAALVDERTALVSVMAVNNEVGTRQPLARIRDVVRERAPHALLHTDAVQATPWLDLRDATAGWDLVSVTGHKAGGPVGTGALVVRRGVPLVAEIEGGGQEAGRRAGTPNVVGAAGLAAALVDTDAHRAAECARIGALRDRLAAGLRAALPDAVALGAADAQVPGFLALALPGVEAEALLVLLDAEGVCASSGSSCSSGATEASHVLQAMGVEDRLALGALRLTLGHSSTEAEVDHALAVIPQAVARLQTAGAR